VDGKLSIWIQNIRYYYQKFTAFRIGVLGGTVGVFVDLDHPIAFFLKIENGRFFHYPILFATFIVFCGLCAYLGGLLLRMVLRKGDKQCIILD